MSNPLLGSISRRKALALDGITGAAGAIIATTGAPKAVAQTTHIGHVAGDNRTVGIVDHLANGFDPASILTDFDYGTIVTDADGIPTRTWAVTAVDREIEIAPGVMFPAWTYNGRIPGPTLRCIEGERLRIVFRNAGAHPHTMHFHGIHSARMDGVPGAGEINPGEEFTYEFAARPFGCHLYHCHSLR